MCVLDASCSPSSIRRVGSAREKKVSHTLHCVAGWERERGPSKLTPPSPPAASAALLGASQSMDITKSGRVN
jgi:hypothetical protein